MLGISGRRPLYIIARFRQKMTGKEISTATDKRFRDWETEGYEARAFFTIHKIIDQTIMMVAKPYAVNRTCIFVFGSSIPFSFTNCNNKRMLSPMRVTHLSFS